MTRKYFILLEEIKLYEEYHCDENIEAIISICDVCIKSLLYEIIYEKNKKSSLYRYFKIFEEVKNKWM